MDNTTLTHNWTTHWFSENQKPVRIGVYEIKPDALRISQCWAVWNGKKWGWRSTERNQAWLDRDLDGAKQNLIWRGLTNEAR